MRKGKRLLACCLAFILLAVLVPAPTAQGAAKTSTYHGTSYSTDYTTWRQGDPAWGTELVGDLHTMAGSGCLITSISILMCVSGAYSPTTFNPGVFRDWLDYKGYISHSSLRAADGSMSYGSMTATTSPRFSFVNQVWFNTASTTMADVCSKIDALQAKGYFVIARVKNSGHFVPIDHTVNDDAVIYDPGYSRKSMLSGYKGTIGGLLYFKANPSGKDTILSLYGTPTAPVVSALKDTYGDGDTISVTWKNSAYASHYNIYVDVKQKGAWSNNYQCYFYADSPFSLDALPAGSYRSKVQATNGNNWSYTDSDYRTFTVQKDSCTVTYLAGGGKVSPDSVLMTVGDLYDLPTPTLSGAAFLGWYTGGGALVTNATKMGQGTAHNLTAKWSKTGVGFSRTATYQNNFKDVASSDWFYPSVSAVYSYGFMNGTGENAFQPAGKVSAAQGITLAARMNQIYLTGKNAFASGTPWYQPYAAYAQKKKIITTLPSDWSASVTRAEFAKWMAAALPEAALPAVNTVSSGSIPDVSSSASYASAVYRLYRAGIFSGRDSKGRFLPNEPITRAEAAAVLVRMANPNLRVLFTLGK